MNDMFRVELWKIVEGYEDFLISEHVIDEPQDLTDLMNNQTLYTDVVRHLGKLYEKGERDE